MWKGHWEDHPQLPDQIYLSAKERVEKDGSQGVPQQEPPELKDPLFFDSDSDGDGDGVRDQNENCEARRVLGYLKVPSFEGAPDCTAN